ncbi:MAG: hypothetical protein K9K67_15830 [Bacteriovoracaceae bacterium]|nr:hypothetical protein [Bacteriovoracaceae bacterium]
MNLKTVAISVFTLGLISTQMYAACPNWSDTLGTREGKEACGLNDSATYSGNLLLTADKLWVLQGGVFIGGDNTDKGVLTIEPGTKIIGNKGADFLVISRGSQIFAQGTKEAPIVFTTGNVGNTDRGQWGGLILNGNAPINTCGTYTAANPCEATGEGPGARGTGVYGGNNPTDNSGVLKYVRVEFAGFEVSPDNELNGVAFQGVGNGTIVDYIQVHKNADDGVEFFGGTVDVKHLLLTGNKDDSMDWTSGWVGRAQFVIIDQFDDAANNGIEADNLSSPMDATPRSNPIISNMTILGSTGAAATGGSGLLLRKGSAIELNNTIFTTTKKGCIDFDDQATVDGGEVILIGNFTFCKKAFEAEEGETWNVADFFSADDFNVDMGETRTSPLDGYVPVAKELTNLGDVTPFGDRHGTWFTAVDFAGAVKDANDEWFKGWTNLARN